eukprot:CAMPEP_0197888924 /NCGR_PEP_ID=MMETSP1439-20131203/22611_1 /TAXON_ID=66791 /ORGANISM="Gonyaulax spinifera, Strain CCMP409" /LENGTH=574 /DNA_ID=CAMNT_0043508857 /DNA_START=50 /DNA_END=1772 /DNA_ORIENTATION=+
MANRQLSAAKFAMITPKVKAPTLELTMPEASRLMGFAEYGTQDKPKECARAVMGLIGCGKSQQAELYLANEVQEYKGSSCKAFYHSIIHACAKLEATSAAVWCATQMVGAGFKPNTVTFNALFDACAKTADINLATGLWRLMAEVRLEPNAITYNTMINVCAKAGAGELAETWIRRMVESGHTPCMVSFSTVIAAFGNTGNMEKAEEWFMEMQMASIKPDKVIYSALIKACAQAGCPSRAEHWFRQMLCSNVRPDQKIYSTVIRTCAKDGTADMAEHWLKHMEAHGCRVDKNSVMAVIHARSKEGNVTQAEYWINRMQSLDMSPSVVSYNAVLNVFVRAGNEIGARLWLNKMRRAWVKPDLVTHTCLIALSMKIGDTKSAEKWLQMMILNGIKPGETTLAALCSGRDGKEATAWAYGAIIYACASVGDMATAHRWLGEVINKGISLPGHVNDAIGLASTADEMGFCRTSQSQSDERLADFGFTHVRHDLLNQQFKSHDITSLQGPGSVIHPHPLSLFLSMSGNTRALPEWALFFFFSSLGTLTVPGPKQRMAPGHVHASDAAQHPALDPASDPS